MKPPRSLFDLAVAVAVVHFVVSCVLVVGHMCTTWDPEPVVATGWTTGAPLWRAILFPLGELPLASLVDRGWIAPLLLVFPLNSCVVGGLAAATVFGVRRRKRGSRAVSGPRSSETPDAPPFDGDFARLHLPSGARPARSSR